MLLPAGLFLSLVLGGLAIATLGEASATRATSRRLNGDLRALEVAEVGLVHAELEICAGTDSAGDGLGTLAGAHVIGEFAVVATQIAGFDDRFRLVATSHVGLSTRRIEAGVRRRSNARFSHALFSDEELRLGVALRTDAYDSRNGLYALQATHLDLGGPYARSGGDVASNESIVGPGLATTWIRGDATPGPGHEYAAEGSLLPLSTVTGSADPASRRREFEPPPEAEFRDAAAHNDNGNWIPLLASPGYNAAAKSMSVSGAGVILMPGGTYFFSSLKVVGGATLKFTGPTKIYVTGDFDVTGGLLANVLGKPEDLQIYSHPYPVVTAPPARPKVVVRGATLLSAAVYAPASDVSLLGVSDVSGSVVGRSVTLPLATNFHYDQALARLGPPVPPTLERLYWRDLTPPRR